MNRFILALAGIMISSSTFASTPVNVNTADAPALAQSLDGVGLAKAQAIVDWREAHGPFESADQLTEVKGIGQALVDRNREAIQVDGGKPGKKPRPARTARTKGTDADD